MAEFGVIGAGSSGGLFLLNGRIRNRWLGYFANNDGHGRTHKGLKIIRIHVDGGKNPQEGPDHNPDHLEQLVKRPPIPHLHKHTLLRQHIM